MDTGLLSPEDTSRTASKPEHAAALAALATRRCWRVTAHRNAAQCAAGALARGLGALNAAMPVAPRPATSTLTS